MQQQAVQPMIARGLHLMVAMTHQWQKACLSLHGDGGRPLYIGGYLWKAPDNDAVLKICRPCIKELNASLKKQALRSLPYISLLESSRMQACLNAKSFTLL